MARLARFERATAWFVARYSIQLSYRRVEGAYYRDELVYSQGLGGEFLGWDEVLRELALKGNFPPAGRVFTGLNPQAKSVPDLPGKFLAGVRMSDVDQGLHQHGG